MTIFPTEDRKCPYCGHEYKRKIYPTERGYGSICPKCHKRSDTNHMRVCRMKSPKLKTCANTTCDNEFYTNRNQKYCITCSEIIRKEQMKLYREKHRNKERLLRKKNEST